MTNDPLKCYVEQLIRTDLARPRPPRLLTKRDLHTFVSHFRDETTKKRVRVVDLAQRLDDTLVVNAEASGLVHNLNIGNLRKKAIIRISNLVHQPVLVAFQLNAKG